MERTSMAKTKMYSLLIVYSFIFMELLLSAHVFSKTKSENTAIPANITDELIPPVVTKPFYSNIDGELIVTPMFLPPDKFKASNTANFQLNNKSAVPLHFYKVLQETEKLEIEALQDSYFKGESAVYNKILSSNGDFIKSVSPGQIFSGNTDLVPPSLSRIISKWKNDPCNEARSSFANIIERRIEEFFPNTKSFNSFKNSFSQETSNNYIKVAENYDKHCLRTIEDAINTGELDKSILSRLVIFTKSHIPFCGGVRISKTKILTARHCFYDYRTGKPVPYADKLLSGIPDTTILAFALDDQYQGHTIDSFSYGEYGLTSQNKTFEIKDDYIFVELNSDKLKGSSIELMTQSAGEKIMHKELMLIGYYVFHNASFRFNSPFSSTKDWREGLRLTKGSYCRVFDKSKNGACFAHACQSLPIFSGSPLVMASHDLNILSMIGVHSRGGEGSARGCTPFEMSNDSNTSVVGKQGGLAVSINWILN